MRGAVRRRKGGSIMAYETNGFNGSAGPIHFTNVRILDATGEYPYTGEVVIQGNRIKQITRGSSRLGGRDSSTARRRDGDRRHGRDA